MPEGRHAWVVVDLGFGDAGKGHLVDALVRRHDAALVVRWHGGAQAGHTVVTDDGRWHTFSQFGAGSFVPGVRTHLGAGFVLHPGAMIVEADHLDHKGVPDVWSRTTLDPRAKVITPFQQAAGRLRELARGDARHGSCGVGFGECVADALSGSDDALVAHDLADRDRLRSALRAQQERKRPLRCDHPLAAPECDLLDDPTVVDQIVDLWTALARRLRLAEAPPPAERWVLEGAQGVLLDEIHGFHPHTTWSDCTASGAISALASLGYDGPRTVLGVHRAYSHRHGAGPLPTEDAGWTERLAEDHNAEGPWQGPFRVGPLDGPLLRYALGVAGPIDALALTCLDRRPGPAVCVAYEKPLADVPDLVPFIENLADRPVRAVSTGPRTSDWRFRG